MADDSREGRLQQKQLMMNERSSRSYENFVKNSEKVKKFQERNEELHEEYIKCSLTKYLTKEQEIKLRIQEELKLKALKAKSMSRNLMEERRWTEDEKVENDFNHFLEKLKRNKGKKEEIEKAMRFRIELKQKKEKNKAVEIKKRLKRQERELINRLDQIEKKSYRNMEKVIKEKQERNRIKYMKKDIQLNSGRGRISRMHSNNAIAIQDMFKANE